MATTDEMRVIVEEVPNGFEAGTEESNGGGKQSKAGYWGPTRGGALLSMLLFEAEIQRNLGRALARDGNRLMAIANAVADELGVDINPNAPRTVYQATGEFGGGENRKLRSRVEELKERLREATGTPVECPCGNTTERFLPEEEGGYCRGCGGSLPNPDFAPAVDRGGEHDGDR